MTSHFEALGFKVDTIDQLDALVRGVIASSEAHRRADGGLTYVRGSESGAALCVHTDASNAVVAVEPFLAPDHGQRVLFREILPNTECVHLSPVAVDVEAAEAVASFAFVTPHLLAWQEALVADTAIDVGVAGIVESIEYPESDGADELVATGMADIPAAPTATATGFVTEHLLRHNEHGGAFEWALLDVMGLAFEVVAACGRLPMPFQTDMVVRVQLRLSGPIWGT